MDLEEILDLIRKGFLQVEIAKMKHMLPSTLSQKISKIDFKQLEEARQEGERVRKEKREEQILNLKSQGHSQTEIARIMHVSPARISQWVKEIDKELIEEAMKVKEKQEKLLNLISQGYFYTQIADIEGVSASMISQRISKIDEVLVRKAMREGRIAQRRILALYDKETEEEDQTKSDEEHNRMTLQEAVILVSIYIKTRQIVKAVQFLNKIANNKNLQYLNVEKMQQLRAKVEEIQKQQEARSLLRAGKCEKEITD